MQRVHSLDTLWVENFDEIALSRTVKEIEANLCFAIFGKNVLPFLAKFENLKWPPPFLGRGKFFENCKPCGENYISLDTLWVENFDEIALSRTVKEIEANLCFAIFGKNSKIQNGRHFWGGENFFAKIAFLRYPVGKISIRNRSISVKEIEGNLCFAIFGKNSKIFCHFWEGKIFFENFDEIALSRLRR